MKSKPKAVVAGHLCVDLTPEFSATDEIISLRPGSVVNVGNLHFSTGGAVSNTGIALSILGIDVCLSAKLGEDDLAEVALRIVNRYGIRNEFSIAKSTNTSYSVVIAAPNSDRIFLHNPGANDSFGYDDIDFNGMIDADLFHFGYPPVMRKMYENGGQELIQIFQKVKELGVTTSLDMSLPDIQSASGKVDWLSIMKGLLPYVDIYVPSLEETLYMLEPEMYVRCLSECKGRDLLEVIGLKELYRLGCQLMSFGVKILLIKCGKAGCYLLTTDSKKLQQLGRSIPSKLDEWAERELFAPAFNARKYVSGTGAGDTCIAGFLGSLLTGRNIMSCLDNACAVGAMCIGTYDAVSGIRPLHEVENMIAAGWERNQIELDSVYWKTVTAQGIYLGIHDHNNV